MPDEALFTQIGSVAYDVINNSSITATNFSLALTVTASAFQDQFIQYPGVIQNRFIGKGLSIKDVQCSIQVNRPYTEQITRFPRFPIQPNENFPFEVFAQTLYQRLAAMVHGIQEVFIGLTLLPKEFDQIFLYHPSQANSRYIERDTTIDEVYIHIEIVRQMEVDPRMVMFPPT
jgi:hypothetical protein